LPAPKEPRALGDSRSAGGSADARPRCFLQRPRRKRKHLSAGGRRSAAPTPTEALKWDVNDVLHRCGVRPNAVRPTTRTQKAGRTILAKNTALFGRHLAGALNASAHPTDHVPGAAPDNLGGDHGFGDATANCACLHPCSDPGDGSWQFDGQVFDGTPKRRRRAACPRACETGGRPFVLQRNPLRCTQTSYPWTPAAQQAISNRRRVEVARDGRQKPRFRRTPRSAFRHSPTAEHAVIPWGNAIRAAGARHAALGPTRPPHLARPPTESGRTLPSDKL